MAETNAKIGGGSYQKRANTQARLDGLNWCGHHAAARAEQADRCPLEGVTSRGNIT